MYDSPISLQELCVDTICCNLEDVFEVYYDIYPTNKDNERTNCKSIEDEQYHYEELSLNHHPQQLQAAIVEENETVVLQKGQKWHKWQKKFRFRDPDLFLITEISEQLLRRLGEKNCLRDSTLALFNAKNSRLQKVKLKNPYKLTKRGLKVLGEHKIVELDCSNVKVPVAEIIDCLGEWSLANLRSFNISRCTFIDSSRYCLIVSLAKLKGLRNLNVSYTEFNQQGLQLICEDLKYLERLDLSATKITSLSPLHCFAETLKSLTICSVKIWQLIPSILELRELRHLDISTEETIETDVPTLCTGIYDILDSGDKLPNLISLDLSGWTVPISSDILEILFKNHRKLSYLGLILNSACAEPILTDKTHPGYKANVVVAGLATDAQISVTLKRHCTRHVYVQKALYHLFQLSSCFRKTRPDLFELVLPAMEAHPKQFGVQMAATACLYNLTRGDLSTQIHPSALSRAVNLTLSAMEHFPKHYQLQKNALLTLCTDRILQEVTFERFRCAKLVLDTLTAFDDTNMNRMAVAICSILAAKVSTAETSELGARPEYMRKLLGMVKNRVESKSADITMKFTLSALWNLTDESAATCAVFLDQGGASLFLNVLTTFRGDSAIETKVLGLLNNIAEVENLRDTLMLDELVTELHELLRSVHIDVSYFAAGIVAHLASDGKDTWKAKSYTRHQMLEELGAAVTGWKVPEGEMVAYRSFKPFFPLLRRSMEHQVQLWAVWAIHHVCTKNPKRYCKMLMSERGSDLLRDILNDDESHPDIKLISKQILEALDANVV